MPEAEQKSPDESPPVVVEPRTVWHRKFRGVLNAEIFSAIVGIIAAVMTAGLFTSSLKDRLLFTPPSSRHATLESLNEQRRALDMLQMRVDSVQRQLGLVASLSSNDTVSPSNEYRTLDRQQTEISTRLTHIERVILTDPAKALDVVLLRRDMDAAKIANMNAVTTLKQDIDRIYDLSKWIIGLMFTMSLGVLSLAAASIFKDRGKQ